MLEVETARSKELSAQVMSELDPQASKIVIQYEQHHNLVKNDQTTYNQCRQSKLHSKQVMGNLSTGNNDTVQQKTACKLVNL